MKITLRSLVCASNCIFWFVAAAIFAGVFGWAFARNVTHREAGGVDFSGHALCRPRNITFTTGFLWKQYPLPVGVKTIGPNIPFKFVDKNFIALLSSGSYLVGKVDSIDGRSFVPSNTMIESGSGESNCDY